MRLATLRLDGGTTAVRVDSDTSATVVDGYTDLSALLSDPDWKAVAERAAGAVVDLADADYAPVVPNPGKIVCVGLKLRHAHHRDGAGAAGIPDAVLEVQRGAHRRVRRCDRARVRGIAAGLGGRAGRRHRQAGVPGVRGGRRRLHCRLLGDQRLHDARLPVPQRCSGTKARHSRRPAASARSSTPTTSSARASRPGLEGEVMQSATPMTWCSPLRSSSTTSRTSSPCSLVTSSSPAPPAVWVMPASPPATSGDGDTVEVSIEGLGSVRNIDIVR